MGEGGREGGEGGGERGERESEHEEGEREGGRAQREHIYNDVGVGRRHERGRVH